MELSDRIEQHRKMAHAYRDGYSSKEVHAGMSYEGWVFADGAVYTSPYFVGDLMIPLDENLAYGAAIAATMEAKAYSITFSDWGPVDFKCWPSDNGFVMRTRWEGHTKAGEKMGFWSIGFVDTNDACEITRWETYVNDDEYGPFLQIAIGTRGPFKDGSGYMDAVARTLEAHGMLDS